jgi:hypothetical protein
MRKSHPPGKLVKFTLDNIPLDTLDQEIMKLLRVIADQEGRPIKELIAEALDWFIARKEAQRDTQHKIIKFRSR